ncbi:hypothetical protein [Treponema succinifaciens]|uniref:hypothetical protein n=1 Tax=Treponema succinifaciens TaxID=167 RepID=UPI0023F3D192|nr:hypothetical protein [Treponema succinifaciens]
MSTFIGNKESSKSFTSFKRTELGISSSKYRQIYIGIFAEISFCTAFINNDFFICGYFANISFMIFSYFKVSPKAITIFLP